MDEASVVGQQFAAGLVYIGCSLGGVAALIGLVGTMTNATWARFPDGPVARVALWCVGLALVGTLLFVLS